MKKLLFIAAIALSGLTLNLIATPSNLKVSEPTTTTTTTTVACQYGQCTSKAKSNGNRCTKCSRQGSSTCWSHRSKN